MPEKRELAVVLSGAPWEDSYGYSRARRVGDVVLVSGTLAVGLPEHATAEEQAHRCLEIIGAALREAGADLSDVVSTHFYLTDANDFDAVGHAHGKIFGNVKPVCTGVVVTALREPHYRVEIEAMAVIGGAPESDPFR